MSTVLLLRDSLKRLYSDYDFVIRPVSKFLLAFLMLVLLQGKLGYFELLSRVTLIGACSVLCMFLPYGAISMVCGAYLVADMSKVSYAMALFAAVTLMLVFVLYYGFRPGTGILMALIPLFFYFRIPYLIPIILGLSTGIYSSVAAVIGVGIWYMIRYFAVHAEEMGRIGTEDIADTFMKIFSGVLKDEAMYLTMAAFVACIILAAVISRTSLKHAWTIGVVTGFLVMAALVLYGDVQNGGADLIVHAAGLGISLIIALLYEFIVYAVDYSATEHLRFEDDDYYYFVKAVPKIKPCDEDERFE